VKNFQNLFLPKYFFTRPVLITTYLWMAYVHFLDFVNNKNGMYATRIAIVTVVFIIKIIILYLTDKILLQRINLKLLPYFFLIAVLIAAAIRGYIFDILLVDFDVALRANAGFRIASSVLNFSIGAILATVAAGKIREHAENVQHLVTEQERLNYVEKVTKDNLDEFVENEIEPIKNQLLVSLKSLKNQNVSDALNTLRKTIDEVVQPLSRKLDQLISQWNPPVDVDTKLKINWKQAAKSAILPEKIDVTLTPLLLSFVGIPTMIANYGVRTGGIIIIQSLVTSFFVYKYVKKIVMSFDKKPSGFFIALLVAGVIQAGLSLIWSYPIDQALGILALTPGATIITGFLISILNSASMQANEVSQQMSVITKELSWGVSRVRTEQHQRSRNLGRKLHGEIQAKLSSAFLLLQNNQNDPDKAQKLLTEITNELIEVVNNLENQVFESQELASVVENIRQTWDGVAQIEFRTDPTLVTEIKKDNLCQTALIDIIPELCFNSIKHGKATKVQVELSALNPNTVLLKVKDNGNSAPVNSKKGLGTKLMEECSISWKREKDQGQIVTSAEFALSS